MVDYIWIDRPDGLTDNGSEITRPDKVTMDWLINERKNTAGRFDFQFVPNSQAKMVNVSWVNFTKNAQGQFKLWLTAERFLQIDITQRENETWIVED